MDTFERIATDDEIEKLQEAYSNFFVQRPLSFARQDQPMPIFLTKACEQLCLLLDESLILLHRASDFVWGKKNSVVLDFISEKKRNNSILIRKKANLSHSDNNKIVTLPLKQTIENVLTMQNKIMIKCYSIQSLWQSIESKALLDDEILFSSLLHSLVI